MSATTIAELARALAERRISSVELTTALLDRIARANPSLNAFVTVAAERALADARAADARRAGGDAGPLVGIPIAHKDVLMTPACPPPAARGCSPISSRPMTRTW